jgi:hypothetical protein
MKRKSLLILSGMTLALAGLLAIASPAMAQGPRGRGGGTGPGGPGNGAASGVMLRDVIDRPALVAEALGITPAELQEAHDAGKTLRDLLIEQNIEMEAFRERLRELEDAAIDQAVADGRITLAQAEQLKDRIGQRGRGGPGEGACDPGSRVRQPRAGRRGNP